MRSAGPAQLFGVGREWNILWFRRGGGLSGEGPQDCFGMICDEALPFLVNGGGGSGGGGLWRMTLLTRTLLLLLLIPTVTERVS